VGRSSDEEGRPVGSPADPCPGETAISRYVREAREGRGAPDTDEHLASCAACRQLVFAIACSTLGQEARPYFELALAGIESSGVTDTYNLALASQRLAQGTPDRRRRIALLERSVALWRSSPGSPGETAEAEWLLARALRSINPRRAIELARAARTGFAHDAVEYQTEIAEIDRFLGPAVRSRSIHHGGS
jgi:hypothetical protein